MTVKELKEMLNDFPDEIVESIENDSSGDGNSYLPSELRIAKRVYEDYLLFRKDMLINNNYTNVNDIEEISNSFLKWIEWNLKK